MSIENNGLADRLFFVHFVEASRKQREFPLAGNLSAELSTVSVDFFALAMRLAVLQPRLRIGRLAG
jgi:hypothetical protein